MSGLIQGGLDRGCDRSPAFEWSVHRRKLSFLLVGVFCFSLQYAVLRVLAGAGWDRALANGVGFVISAQVNFVLSSAFTWADRAHDADAGGPISKRYLNANRARWVSYNGTAALALMVNTIVFAAADRVVEALPAVMAGVVAGTVVTFLVCDRLIFAGRATPPTRAVGAASAIPSAVSPASLASSTCLTATERFESLWESVS